VVSQPDLCAAGDAQQDNGKRQVIQ